MPNLGGIRTVDCNTVARIDIVTVGFPCQGVFQLGTREGIIVRPGLTHPGSRLLRTERLRADPGPLRRRRRRSPRSGTRLLPHGRRPFQRWSAARRRARGGPTRAALIVGLAAGGRPWRPQWILAVGRGRTGRTAPIGRGWPSWGRGRERRPRSKR